MSEIVPVDRLRAGGCELARRLAGGAVAGGAIALAQVSGDGFLVLLLLDRRGCDIARLDDPLLVLFADTAKGGNGVGSRRKNLRASLLDMVPFGTVTSVCLISNRETPPRFGADLLGVLDFFAEGRMIGDLERTRSLLWIGVGDRSCFGSSRSRLRPRSAVSSRPRSRSRVGLLRIGGG